MREFSLLFCMVLPLVRNKGEFSMIFFYRLYSWQRLNRVLFLYRKRRNAIFGLLIILKLVFREQIAHCFEFFFIRCFTRITLLGLKHNLYRKSSEKKTKKQQATATTLFICWTECDQSYWLLPFYFQSRY